MDSLGDIDPDHLLMLSNPATMSVSSSPSFGNTSVGPPLEKKRKYASEMGLAHPPSSRHKLTEQKGRQKINNQINDLKVLLPECKYVITTKAAVLECAVKSLKRLQTLCNQLMQTNKDLQKENKRLRMELDRLSSINGHQAFNFSGEDGSSMEEMHTPQMPSVNSLGIPDMQDLLQVDGLFDPFVMGDFSPPPSTPSSLSSPFSAFEEEEPEVEDYKFSRRKLLLVFLFMIPFLVSMRVDQFLPGSVDFGMQTSRVLQGSSEATQSFINFLFNAEVLKVVWYLILGIVFLTWVANTLLWVNGFGKTIHYGRENFNKIFSHPVAASTTAHNH